MCAVRRVLLRAGGRVYLGYEAGDRNNRRILETNGGAVAAKILEARRSADDDYRTSHYERLHIPAKQRRPEKMPNLFCSAESVQELAVLVE
jgi:hypothetical protein